MDEKPKLLVHEISDIEFQDDDANDAISEKKLMRKIDWTLLPLLSLLYLLSFLDRTNIGNARLAGLEHDLKLHGMMYNIALAAFFPTYALAEVPSNAILKATRPSIWIPTIMVAWGIICVCMGFVHNFAGLVVTRAFLGLTEGGLLPGIAFYITMWYQRHECGLRIAIFFASATAAGAFGGLLARAIMMMRGVAGRPGWSWIFILEGIGTLAVALFSYYAMQDYPDTAQFLTNDERRQVKRRLDRDRECLADEYATKYVWQALADWKIYVFSVIGVGLALPVYSVSLFLPTIIKTLGYKDTTAQLFTVPPYVFGCTMCILGGYLADKMRTRGIFLIGFGCTAIIGFTMLMTAHSPRVKYAGCFFVAGGVFPATPQAIAWSGNNIGGSTKRAIGIGMFVGFVNLGAMVSSFIYLPKFAPTYHTGHSILLVSVSLSCTLAACMSVYLRRENARRESIKSREHYTKEEMVAERERGDYASFFRYTV